MEPNVYSVVANGNTITLSVGDYEEPNNGRCVRPAELTINDLNRTKEYLGVWNKLICNFDKVQFASDDKRYCFIPQEGPAVVMDTKTLETFKVGSAGFYFVGNSFYGTQHLLVDR
jgi:hypothetical protein